MEDLEGLSAGCSVSTGSDGSLTSHHSSEPSSTFFELPSGNHGGVGDEDVLRVDDLVAPVPTRAEYEQELPETRCKSDHGFEIIDFEEEVGVFVFR